MARIEETLSERGKIYGDFQENSITIQAMKDAIRESPKWIDMTDDKKEALDMILHMILHKIGRIVIGDPNCHDSWHDIQGYARLVTDRLEKAGQVSEAQEPAREQASIFPPFTKSEKMISDAIIEIEKLGTGFQLTDAVIKLVKARNLVSRFIDDDKKPSSDRPIKYNHSKWNNSHLGRINDKEPIFILRGQDATAARIIDIWIDINLQNIPLSKLYEARSCRDAMNEWPTKKDAD